MKTDLPNTSGEQPAFPKAGGSRPILFGKAEEIPEPKPDLTRLQMRIEKHLEAIEKVLGPKYCLTLVANYIGPDRLDADIVLTMSTRDRVIAAVERFVPASGANDQLRKMIDLGITPQDVADTRPPGMPGSDDPHAALVFARHRQKQGLV